MKGGKRGILEYISLKGMKCRGKFLGGLLAALLVMTMSSITAFADDYSFDITKSKPTYGGGQAFTAYTRLDNEKRDKYKFNPLWITEESTVEIDYTVTDTTVEYEGTPIYFVFQSWKGDKVSSQEDKWIQITPSVLTDSHATWTYDDIVSAYGSNNFSDVYAFVIEDNGTAGVEMTSLTITNVSVPKDEIANLTDGVVLRDGEIVVVSDDSSVLSDSETVSESDAISDISNDATDENTVSDSDANTSTSDVDDSSAETVAAQTTVVEQDSSDSTMTSAGMSKVLLIICIALGVALVGVIIFIVIKTIRNRNRGWH